MSLDTAEAVSNAVIGLAVSTAAVWALRASGAWLTAPAWTLAVLFFLLSLARSRVLRALFRSMEARRAR